MAEYIEREKVIDTLYAILCKYPIGRNPSDYEYGINCAINFAKDQIENIPVADVQPVVFCRDCKNAHMTHDGLCKYCDVMIEYGVDDSLYFPGDYFCADGERKANNG